MTKTYGEPDADSSVLEALLDSLGDAEVRYILHHQRMPINARPCKLPCSLIVQAVLTNEVVVTAFQAEPGARIQITRT